MTMPASPLWTIGEAAKRSGVSARMIRHYESLGLLPAVKRTQAGYRLYSQADVHTLGFIKRARELGFSVAEIAKLLSLWQDQRRSNASVREIAQQHLHDLQGRIESMQAMHDTLAHLVHCCQRHARPECPILQDLAGVASSEGPALQEAPAQHKARARKTQKPPR